MYCSTCSIDCFAPRSIRMFCFYPQRKETSRAHLFPTGLITLEVPLQLLSFQCPTRTHAAWQGFDCWETQRVLIGVHGVFLSALSLQPHIKQSNKTTHSTDPCSVVIIQNISGWINLPSLKGVVHPNIKYPFLLFMLFQSHMTDWIMWNIERWFFLMHFLHVNGVQSCCIDTKVKISFVFYNTKSIFIETRPLKWFLC